MTLRLIRRAFCRPLDGRPEPIATFERAEIRQIQPVHVELVALNTDELTAFPAAQRRAPTQEVVDAAPAPPSGMPSNVPTAIASRLLAVVTLPRTSSIGSLPFARARALVKARKPLSTNPLMVTGSRVQKRILFSSFVSPFQARAASTESR